MADPRMDPRSPLETGSPELRARAVRDLFASIAPRYDLLNHLLSLNVDRRWRRRAVDRLGWEERPDGTYLDACAGTLDLALELARRPGFRGSILGADFAVPMLRRGLEKREGAPVHAACADTLRLPLSTGSVDGAMVGFGVRNLADIDAGLRELLRVLRPGSRAVVLDFALPPSRLLRGPYLFYFTRVLPLVGRLVSKHSYAYSYLPESVLRFATPEDLAGRLRASGFEGVRWERMTAGIACNWVGRRPL